ncbi:MAG: UDP-4-amino-4,6-dideoxy-N-acetyl-beta-L-altrosamine transaminase [Campylobacter sp.]|nr:UDP-4-amino-4,6-dideoxy-N-acetyl-beta-L-altrosamine transaminase [Campylobacter sp.]
MKFIPYSRQQITNDDILAVSNALKHDILTGGEGVEKFEKAIANYIGIKHVVAMNSATSVLHSAYLALGLKSGDEIISTPITFAATANAALMCGADIKFCDVKADGNIDENKIEALISPKTKVITAVDYGGNPVNIDEILKIAKKHNLKVIDDASHALGSSQNGVKVGAKADISVFSFHPVKPLTTLEGGGFATNDENLAKKAKLFRNHGISKTHHWDSDMSVLGYNYRLSDVACALGLNQLKRLDAMIAKRNEIAAFYDENFDHNPWLDIVKIPRNALSSRHLYPLLLKQNFWAKKEEIFDEFLANGIGVQVHYKPTYKFSFYRQKYGELYCPNAENFYQSELSIPCHQEMSLDDAKMIVQKTNEILEKHK